ncbi:uncharacterized protein LOC136078816 [Hydra vulgaris]|uniref:Uncharacterized protein LOC136078816 n=1 Tax=Hydra vulgaris TaxID=6087 RepID=A0ABM4BNM3_HYDVU
MLRRNSKKPRSCWYKIGRSDKWWKNMISGISPESYWFKNFRLSKSAFMNLAEQLKPFIAPNPKSPNYRALSTEKKLAITLYYLKDTGSLIMTANCFGIAVNTVSSIITQVCEKIVYHLGPIYISLPKKEIEMRQKVAELESKFGMIQAFGCIDGAYVPIACPVENSQDYFCYKQYYSMNVQAVCDYKGMFMDVECVWLGSVHDSKVFCNSSKNKKLRDGFLPGTFQSVLHGYFKLELVPIIVYATFVLHNFCEKHKTLVDSDSVNNQVQLIKYNEETYINQPNPVYSNNTAEREFT